MKKRKEYLPQITQIYANRKRRDYISLQKIKKRKDVLPRENTEHTEKRFLGLEI
jgi:hypothetical protein